MHEYSGFNTSRVNPLSSTVCHYISFILNNVWFAKIKSKSFMTKIHFKTIMSNFVVVTVLAVGLRLSVLSYLQALWWPNALPTQSRDRHLNGYIFAASCTWYLITLHCFLLEIDRCLTMTRLWLWFHRPWVSHGTASVGRSPYQLTKSRNPLLLSLYFRPVVLSWRQTDFGWAYIYTTIQGSLLLTGFDLNSTIDK